MDLKTNWKLFVIAGLVLLAGGFGLGRFTVDQPKTVVVDTKTEVVKKEVTKIDAKVEDHRTVVTNKGPVRTVTKKKTTKPDGEVSEEETTTNEGPVVVAETSDRKSDVKTDIKKDEHTKSETHSETTAVSRDWLLGVSASYSVKDVITQKWTAPSIDGQVGYRLLKGVYPTLNGGFDTSAGKLKVGVGVVVTF